MTQELKNQIRDIKDLVHRNFDLVSQNIMHDPFKLDNDETSDISEKMQNKVTVFYSSLGLKPYVYNEKTTNLFIK